MSERKLILYQVNSSKPIVITDNEQVKTKIEDILVIIRNALKSPTNSLFELINQKDYLGFKTQEIAGFMLSSDSMLSVDLQMDDTSKIEVTPIQEESAKQDDYQTELVIEDVD
jgi:hypothetical protein